MRHSWGIFAVYISLVAAISSESPVHPFAVIGYLPEWRFEGANWDYLAATCTHLLLFSLEPTPDGRITALDRLPRSMLLEEARAAASKHDSRLLLCFGGNGRSSGFSAMARSASSRQKFVGSLVALIEEHGLHGVDYNVSEKWAVLFDTTSVHSAVSQLPLICVIYTALFGFVVLTLRSGNTPATNSAGVTFQTTKWLVTTRD